VLLLQALGLTGLTAPGEEDRHHSSLRLTRTTAASPRNASARIGDSSASGARSHDAGTERPVGWANVRKVPRAARGRLLSCPRVEFPEFPYHPDPRATGSVVVSDTSCVACGQSRGFVYAGPVYSQGELIDSLCPWCIADGSAAEKYEAEFTDVGWGVPADPPRL
jgi:hypothetical protein